MYATRRETLIGSVGLARTLGPLHGSQHSHVETTPARSPAVQFHDDTYVAYNPSPPRLPDGVSDSNPRGPLGRPSLERRHSYGALGSTLLGHKRQRSNSTPERLVQAPNKNSIASSRNTSLRSPPRMDNSGGPYAFYNDRLGTLVRGMVDRLQRCGTWKEFVEEQRGRSYLHQDIGKIPHPAAAFLDDLRVNGVPAKTTEPDL